MANTRYYNVDISGVTISNLSLTKMTSSLIQITGTNFVQNFNGSFSYSGGYISGGTLTSMTTYIAGQKVEEVTGLSADAYQAFDAIAYGTVDDFFGLLYQVRIPSPVPIGMTSSMVILAMTR